MKKFLLIVLAVILFSANTFGQEIEKRVYNTSRISKAPVINGVIDENEWTEGEWGRDFTQFEPYSGDKPTQPTEFKILHDDNFIYVVIKAYDSSPDSIINRMTRRDQVDGDYIGVSFDSYHDLRTGFTFIVSSTGVKTDLIHANDGMVEDPSWDPIWYVESSIQEWGWMAEMKIPLTQLRFEKNTGEVWGMEAFRLNYRETEMSFWQAIPRNASGLVHMYGELDGLDNIEPRKILDLVPYTVASYENYQPVEGNPFMTGKKFTPSVGLDGKMGITNNLTLDFTVNPDFGQVEADPSQVNLTAYESYFREQRPFFVEGNNITRLGLGIGDGSTGNDNLFYSRRIGSSPSGYARLENGEYSDTPRNVRILGAAKITGKTNDGLSVGLIESVTPRTYSRIDSAGERTVQEVEPLTNYFVGRVQKDLNKGNTQVGGMLTHTYRFLDLVENLEESPLNRLHNSALAGGMDFSQYFDDRNWRLTVNAAASQVNGSQEAISATQLSGRHLMHRPDAGHMEYDSSRTSLSGWAGKMEFGKFGGNWNFMAFSAVKSPGFEINDLGYMRETDNMLHGLWGAYSINEPKNFYRRIRFNANWYTTWDYGFTFKSHGGNISVFTQYQNSWTSSIAVNYNSRGVSTSMLRGGPNIKFPGGVGGWYNINSDNRKKFRVSLNGNHFWGNKDYQSNHSVSLNLSYRPVNTLNISLNPRLSSSNRDLQYVRALQNEEGETDYIFAHLLQRVLSMSLRLNYNITPELSIQYWGQPFFAAADYSGFKVITNPMADNYNDRQHIFTSDEISKNEGVYHIDRDTDGNTDYSFGNPDFNFDEFLSNLVFRWEFTPGSTLFLVWSQSRDAYIPTGEFVLQDNINTLFTEEKAYNVFLLKFSYRFGLR